MSTSHKAFEDKEYEEGVLTDVTPYKSSDGWSVTSSNGWSCGVSAEYGVIPKVGDDFVTWGSIGRPIRGQAIRGIVLYYRTPDEQKVEDAKTSEKIRAERVAEYEGKRSDFDRRVAALPDPLRERVEGFRAFKGEGWRHEFEPYEVFCCEEAVKIATHFNTADKIQKFAKMKYDAQKAAFPQMSDQHSGNTFGMSVRLAYHLAEHPELLAKEHGALCPLVGCESYGCFASRTPETSR